MLTAGTCPLQNSGGVEPAPASYCSFNLGGTRKTPRIKATCLTQTREDGANLWKFENISAAFNGNMQIPVVGDQLQLFGGNAHVKGALTVDQTGGRTFWAGFSWQV